MIVKTTYLVLVTEETDGGFKGDFLYRLGRNYHLSRNKYIILTGKAKITTFRNALRKGEYLFLNGKTDKDSKEYIANEAVVAERIIFRGIENSGWSSRAYGEVVSPGYDGLDFIDNFFESLNGFGLYACYGLKTLDGFQSFYKERLFKKTLDIVGSRSKGFFADDNLIEFWEYPKSKRTYHCHLFENRFTRKTECPLAYLAIDCKVVVTRKPFHDKETLYGSAAIDFYDYPDNEEILSSEPFMKGYFANIFRGDSLSLKGYWQKEKSKYVFRVLQYERDFSNNEKLLLQYLELHMSKMIANRLLKAHGLDSLEEARKGVETFRALGLGKKKSLEVLTNITMGQFKDEIFEFFMLNNIDHKTAVKIYKRYHTGTLDTIKENPYQLCFDVNISFKEADEIAYSLGFLADNDDRLKAALRLFLQYQTNSFGHLFIYEKDIFREFNNFLRFQSFMPFKNINKERVTDILLELETHREIVSENHVSGLGKCWYLSYYSYIENEITSKLNHRWETFYPSLAKESKIHLFIDEYELSTGFKFAKRQKEAIFTAISSGFSVLTGGPGTGKTQTLNGFIKCIKSLSKDTSICLLAPTGKAAKRMSEMTGISAQTIHRKLKYIPFENSQLEDLSPIDEDYVIIDEASMIDADLFFKLLKSVSEHTRILLVGDADQIPSVGPGLIFKDIISSGIFPVVVLDEIFRQSEGSTIVENAYKIINSNKDLTGNSKDFIMTNKINSRDIQKTVLDTIELELENGNKLEDIQVLTPANKGDLGTFELNRLIQGKFNKEEEMISISPLRSFRKNDRVLQTRNNYNLNVFNGSVGTIDSVFEEEMNIEMDDLMLNYKGSDLDDILLAYAMTIHKSQGSEFPVIIIPIHHSHSFLNNKNLFYTGVTRSQVKVHLIGDLSLISSIVRKEGVATRNSQILDKLKERCLVQPAGIKEL